MVRWNSLFSVIKKIDIASFICEENCRYCGRAVPSAGEQHRSLTEASAISTVEVETAPPPTCLCFDCHQTFLLSRQSVWWLPLAGNPSPGERLAPVVERPAQAAGEISLVGTASGTGDLLPVATAGMYEGALQKLIRRLKYDDDRLVVFDIKPLLDRAYRALVSSVPQLSSDENVLIVPIPLHGSRKRKRGYNQAQLLAKELAVSNRLTVNCKILKRIKKTRPQYGLKKQERLNNLKDAFCLGNVEIKDKSIILVDDVFTSGATLTSCASLLTAGGAKFVAAIAAARAPYDKDGP